MNLEVDVTVTKESQSEFRRDLGKLADYFDEILTKIGKAIPEQVGLTFEAVYEDIGKNYLKLRDSLGIATQNAIRDSIGPYFRGEMDKVEDIWNAAWDNMVTAAEKQFAKLMSDFVGSAIQLSYNIFKEAIFNPEEWFQKSVVGTVEGWGTNLKNWVVGALGGGKTSTDSAGNVLSGATGVSTIATGASKLYSWITGGTKAAQTTETLVTSTEELAEAYHSSQLAAESLNTVTETATLSQEAAIEAARAEIAALTQTASEATAQTAAVIDSAVTATESTAELTATVAGAALSPATLFGGAGAVLAAGHLLAASGILGGNEMMTPEEAQELIKEEFDNIAVSIEVATERAQVMGDMFAGYLNPELVAFAGQIAVADDAVLSMAELAGYTADQIQQMTGALGEQGTVVMSAADVANTLTGRLADLAYNFSVVNEGGMSSAGTFDQLNLLLIQYVNSLGLSSEATEALTGKVLGLALEIYGNNQNIEEVAKSLQGEFVSALESVIAAGDATAETFQSIRTNIESIPTSWSTEYRINEVRTYTDVTSATSGQESESEQPETSAHGGGLIMHGGGFLAGLPRMHSGSLVSALAHDEVPVIARRGEYMVRAESVNAATLPLLQALNQTGRAQAATAAPTVNLHVEVHGNILGGQENMEELARIMERKLRDISQSRYAA